MIKSIYEDWLERTPSVIPRTPDTCKVCQGCFNGVKRVFKEVSKKFHGSSKKVPRVFQECFKGV